MLEVKYYRPDAGIYDLRYFKSWNELDDWKRLMVELNQPFKIIDIFDLGTGNHYLHNGEFKY